MRGLVRATSFIKIQITNPWDSVSRRYEEVSATVHDRIGLLVCDDERVARFGEIARGRGDNRFLADHDFGIRLDCDSNVILTDKADGLRFFLFGFWFGWFQFRI